MKMIAYKCDLCGEKIDGMAMQPLAIMPRNPAKVQCVRVVDPEKADRHVCESCVRVICGPEIKSTPTTVDKST